MAYGFEFLYIIEFCLFLMLFFKKNSIQSFLTCVISCWCNYIKYLKNPSLVKFILIKWQITL